MPWRFRKVFRIGHMRAWISRTGIGYSWGFPGFRVGVAANGRRYLSVGIPGTGLYFYKYFRSRQPANMPRSKQVQGRTIQHWSPPPGNSAGMPAPSNAPQSNRQPWWKQKNLP